MNEQRLHGLDALRALALLLGILLHAVMSFTPGLGELGWPIVDDSRSTALGALLFVIHQFRMMLFFLLAGFFARMLWHRRGAGGFWRDRAKRILLPLVAFWPVVVPLLGAAMYWAALQSGKVPQAPKPPPGTVAVFPLAHLWFLYVLLWLYAIALALRAVLRRVPGLASAADRLVERLCKHPFAGLLLAVPLALALLVQPHWIAWAGIPTPDHSLLPYTTALIGFGTAFAFGWLLRRQPRLLDAIARNSMLHLAAAVALSAVGIALIGPTPLPAEATPTGRMRAVCAFSYAAGTWCWCFALLGLAMRFWSDANPLRRYMADASYWLYLMHLPIVFALQTLVMRWPLHWSLKLAFVLGVTMVALLVSYRWLVRPTWVGAWLNGRRYPRGTSEPA